jgi:RNA polymerase sigma-B factor
VDGAVSAELAAITTRNALVERHRGLAIGLASRFAGKGEEMDDLVQVALMALTKAIDRYDAERGVALSTYATVSILGELKRHFRDRGWAVRPPRRVHELYLRVQPTVYELGQQLGRSPTIAEIAEQLRVPEEEVIEAIEAGARRTTTSLDAGPREGGAGDGLAAGLGAADAGFSDVDLHVSIRPLLARLAERERRILYLRFFMGMSQSEIAADIGISQMHVSRLLNRSLERLRRWSVEHPRPEPATEAPESTPAAQPLRSTSATS